MLFPTLGVIKLDFFDWFQGEVLLWWIQSRLIIMLLKFKFIW